jgi:hypothetical protein
MERESIINRERERHKSKDKNKDVQSKREQTMTHRKIEKGSKTHANRDNDISCTETHTKIHTMKKKEQKYIDN